MGRSRSTSSPEKPRGLVESYPHGGTAAARRRSRLAPLALRRRRSRARRHLRPRAGRLRRVVASQRAPAREPRDRLLRRPPGIRRLREAAHALPPRLLRERAARLHGRARARAGLARRPLARRRRLDHARADAPVARRAAGARRLDRARLQLPPVVDLSARRAPRARRALVARRHRPALQGRARALLPRARPARDRLLRRLPLCRARRRRGARRLPGDASPRAHRLRDALRGLPARADHVAAAGAVDPRPPGSRGARGALRGGRRRPPARGGSLGRWVWALPADRARRSGERVARRLPGRPAGTRLAEQSMDEISAQELQARLGGADRPLLLDVRQDWETRLCRLENAVHIPIEEIEMRVDELNADDEIVVYCHQGVRSAAVADYLRQRGFKNVKNLRGGLDSWARTVDPSMRRY